MYEEENKGNVIALNYERLDYEYDLKCQNHDLTSRYVPVSLEGGSSLKIEAINYLMEMVEGMAEGYYEVRNASLSLRDGQLKLCLDLNQYHPLKSGWSHIGKYNNGDIFPFSSIKR